MAGKFKLDTVKVSGLSQVLVAVPSGKTYDHKAQEVAGVVTVASEQDRIDIRKVEKGGIKVLTEE